MVIESRADLWKCIPVVLLQTYFWATNLRWCMSVHKRALQELQTFIWERKLVGEKYFINRLILQCSWFLFVLTVLRVLLSKTTVGCGVIPSSAFVFHKASNPTPLIPNTAGQFDNGPFWDHYTYPQSFVVKRLWNKVLSHFFGTLVGSACQPFRLWCGLHKHPEMSKDGFPPE